MSFVVKVLKAAHGDCIFIQGIFDNGEHKNILIDGGPSKAYKYRKYEGELFKELEDIRKKDQIIDLLILTHVDDDHIGGLLSAFKNGELLDKLTKKVWFNSGKLIFDTFDKVADESNYIDMGLRNSDGQGLTSIGQGVTFESYLEKNNIWDKKLIIEGEDRELFGAKFIFLSPTKEKLEKLLIKWKKDKPESLTSSKVTDYDKTFDELLVSDKFKNDKSVHNGSSIAFIFEYKEKRILLLGDAHDDVIVDSLKKKIEGGQSNRFELVKLSHHGSKNNTSASFLNLIECNDYVISTDASKHGLPNKLTLARIFDSKPKASIHFNYPEIIKLKIFKSEQERTDIKNSGFNISNSGTIFNYD
ncbi:MAG: MBL fold metallo-hydrolase [Oleispira antarctica]|nr:MBL fold metallo-hydrolase [Oleispira antarctica]